MTTNLSAIVLGASGSVGGALVRELITSGTFTDITTIGRRSQPELVAQAAAARVTLHETLLDAMDPPHLEEAARNAALAAATPAGVGGVVGFSVLGIGAGTAKLTLEQHRAVDVALNAAFARGLAASGRVRHIALMSAAGADVNASTTGSGAAGGSRYSRVKGEAEAAVQASGVPVVSIFRPAMIIGSQHTPWLLEKLLPLFSAVTPSRLRSISVEQIAAAMVSVAREASPTSAVYNYPEMMARQRR